jgi:DNA-binding Lrp family transcriptional regulator
VENEQNDSKSNNSSIDAIDAKLALLLIETPSLTDQELAEKLGISRPTVNRRKNGPAVQKIIRATLTIPEKEMRRLATKALARLEAQLDNEDPKIQHAAALALVKLSERFIGNDFSLSLWHTTGN